MRFKRKKKNFYSKVHSPNQKPHPNEGEGGGRQLFLVQIKVHTCDQINTELLGMRFERKTFIARCTPQTPHPIEGEGAYIVFGADPGGGVTTLLCVRYLMNKWAD